MTSPALLRWQKTLLPLMAAVLIGLTVVFVGVSLLEYGRLSKVLSESHAIQIDSLLGDRPAGTVGTATDAFRSRALIGLEAHAMEHRYRQVNLVMLTRAWTRYMGFVTGMVLAMVGAVFILGKLQESVSKFEAGQGEHGRVAFESASPGLFLAFFGTILMALAIWLTVDVTSRDAAVYVTPLMTIPSPPATARGDSAAGDAFILQSKPLIPKPTP
jgi:hypothetical protein